MQNASGLFGGANRLAHNPTSRGTNFCLVPILVDWVWQLATGGDGGDRRPLRVLQGLSTIALRRCPTTPFSAKKLATGNFFIRRNPLGFDPVVLKIKNHSA